MTKLSTQNKQHGLPRFELLLFCLCYKVSVAYHVVHLKSVPPELQFAIIKIGPKIIHHASSIAKIRSLVNTYNWPKLAKCPQICKLPRLSI